MCWRLEFSFRGAKIGYLFPDGCLLKPMGASNIIGNVRSPFPHMGDQDIRNARWYAIGEPPVPVPGVCRIFALREPGEFA